MTLATCIIKATEKLCIDRNGVVTREKKNLPWFDLPWFGVEYDFYPTHCMLYVENTQLVG